MPHDVHRFYGAGDLHFVTFSCHQRQPLLSDARRRDLLLEILERVRRRYRLVVLGYVVMPEHLHLLLSEPQRETLSTVVQALKLLFPGLAKAAGPGVPSSASGNPDSDFNVWTELKRVEKLRYMHRNPVKRGLVASPEQWEWSSFRWYL